MTRLAVIGDPVDIIDYELRSPPFGSYVVFNCVDSVVQNSSHSITMIVESPWPAMVMSRRSSTEGAVAAGIDVTVGQKSDVDLVVATPAAHLTEYSSA